MSARINLLEGNITSSLARLALPLMGMSLLQMAYNLTDIFWIGKLGAEAVAAVGTGGLLLWLCVGIHTLAQLGGQVLVAQNLGSGDKKRASSYAHASIFLSISISILLGFAFFFFNEPIIAFFNLNNSSTISDARIYIMIAGGFIVFSLLGKLLTALITTTGDSKTPFIASSIGLIFNMILDPILIFGLLGLPQLGVLGAAIATVLAQFIVFIILTLYIVKDNHLFCFINFKKLPQLNLCKDILKLGLPVTLQASLFPLISIFISRMVASFGDNAVAVQRVGSQIESISWGTAEGFAIAVNSFIAQNYGANNIKRVKQGFYKAASILGSIGLFATLLLVFCGEYIFAIFLSDPSVTSMGRDYMIIIGFSQLFMCLEILSGNAMNALGKTVIPASISITFTAIRIPLALILSVTTLGLCGIWWSISISTICKGTLLMLAICISLKKLKQKI